MAESVAGVVNEYENVDGNVLAKLLAGMPDPQIRYALAVRNRSQDAASVSGRGAVCRGVGGIPLSCWLRTE